MVDNMNPTSQFHPYQPETSKPQTGMRRGGLGGMLNNFDFRGNLNKARGMARNNGGLVLGGLAALAIGAGLMRKRAMR